MKVSVIIPTLNEGENIAQAISRIRLSSDLSRVEIIVADGGSLDRTLEIARAMADQACDFTASRAHQMHQSALAASGEYYSSFTQTLAFLMAGRLLCARLSPPHDKPIATAC